MDSNSTNVLLELRNIAQNVKIANEKPSNSFQCLQNWKEFDNFAQKSIVW